MTDTMENELGILHVEDIGENNNNIVMSKSHDGEMAEFAEEAKRMEFQQQPAELSRVVGDQKSMESLNHSAESPQNGDHGMINTESIGSLDHLAESPYAGDHKNIDLDISKLARLAESMKSPDYPEESPHDVEALDGSAESPRDREQKEIHTESVVSLDGSAERFPEQPIESPHGVGKGINTETVEIPNDSSKSPGDGDCQGSNTEISASDDDQAHSQEKNTCADNSSFTMDEISEATEKTETRFPFLRSASYDVDHLDVPYINIVPEAEVTREPPALENTHIGIPLSSLNPQSVSPVGVGGMVSFPVMKQGNLITTAKRQVSVLKSIAPKSIAPKPFVLGYIVPGPIVSQTPLKRSDSQEDPNCGNLNEDDLLQCKMEEDTEILKVLQRRMSDENVGEKKIGTWKGKADGIKKEKDTPKDDITVENKYRFYPGKWITIEDEKGVKKRKVPCPTCKKLYSKLSLVCLLFFFKKKGSRAVLHDRH